jgi:putative ABC transport system permease protein
MLTLVATETGAWLLAGALVGVALGVAMAAVLVHVVNPQSFHWTMPLHLPAARLAALAGAVLLAGGLTALLAARRVAGRDAVLAVKEDW